MHTSMPSLSYSYRWAFMAIRYLLLTWGWLKYTIHDWNFILATAARVLRLMFACMFMRNHLLLQKGQVWRQAPPLRFSPSSGYVAESVSVIV
ncbi:hypothetical protein DEU56DRAFT_790936 [Suillus clintonianus]|uniref:uncharacterized protein n=1 Tax=Suillus clintonianus TaxID=1904413 RepID=UPI001B87517E|nr:uncharacterized protein DEU56DRAFT_790936 [Suillus clintonianus]KAG2144273.1 hypothetical protein DEU56DRAFT_790936 [Suillus clintonianus]